VALGVCGDAIGDWVGAAVGGVVAAAGGVGLAAAERSAEAAGDRVGGPAIGATEALSAGGVRVGARLGVGSRG
jgi:hypothetical protein